MSKRKVPPTNGSEIPFRLEPWLSKGKRSNNCYAYAFNDYESYRTHKSVPGARVGKDGFHTYTHCKGLAKRVVSDNPGKVYVSKPMSKCRRGYYKAMMVVAPSNIYGNFTGDFHFYKQHSSVIHRIKKGESYASIARTYGVPYSRILKAANKRPAKPGMRIRFNVNLFSHKQGWGTGPLLKDSCGKLIKNPATACRKYGYNYSKYCNSFCVKNKGIDVGSGDAKVGKYRTKII